MLSQQDLHQNEALSMYFVHSLVPRLLPGYEATLYMYLGDISHTDLEQSGIEVNYDRERSTVVSRKTAHGRYTLLCAQIRHGWIFVTMLHFTTK